MKAKRSLILPVLVMGFSALVANAQWQMRSPQFRGVWNPVVGSGAVYQVESQGSRKMEMEIAVVDSETVNGKPGYWLEMAMKDPHEGQMYMKHLIVLDGRRTQIKRMIVQPANQPPMEMPIEMMRGGGTNEQPTDVREQADHIGTESVTTPAGTFTCEHYRMKDGSADVWVAEKIAPYGLVKMTGRDANMTLVRVISNAKTHITGTPQKFDPMEMMRRQMDKE